MKGLISKWWSCVSEFNSAWNYFYRSAYVNMIYDGPLLVVYEKQRKKRKLIFQYSYIKR